PGTSQQVTVPSRLGAPSSQRGLRCGGLRACRTDMPSGGPHVGGTMKNRKVGALATAAALALVLTSCANSARDTDDPAEADNGGDATQTEGGGESEAPA